jgi:hypothetical protein
MAEAEGQGGGGVAGGRGGAQLQNKGRTFYARVPNKISKMTEPTDQPINAALIPSSGRIISMLK